MSPIINKQGETLSEEERGQSTTNIYKSKQRKNPPKRHHFLKIGELYKNLIKGAIFAPLKPSKSKLSLLIISLRH